MELITYMFWLIVLLAFMVLIAALSILFADSATMAAGISVENYDPYFGVA